MYTTLRDYRFNRDIDDIRGSTVYGTGDEKLGKIDDVIFDSDSGQIRYLVIDTGGWLSSRRFLVPPEEAQPSTTHEDDFTVNMTKAQIERFPALDEKVLEDKQDFENYEKSYRSSWTEPVGRKPASNTRVSTFQNAIVRDRNTICGTETRTRKVG
ncbi:MAG: PRC-barrel domain-containing protein [Acidobacteria bacterium]|nr:PRC-barrel domain-containing protein [Acidobacteriota bacterium]